MKEKRHVFIIAELSANHNNSYSTALKSLEEIKKSGADAVKIQTFRPKSLTLDINIDPFGPKKEGLWKGYRPWDLYKKAAMPYEWQPKLKIAAEKLDLVFFSSPFDIEAVDFLESMSTPMYKVASFEITDIPLISYIASKGKPIIISTGLAGIEDIELAIEACYNAGNRHITLLKCTSEYPATIDKANLRTIIDMKERFKVNIGVSDHTLGYVVPMVAVSLGARIIEKHFTLDRSLGGIDSSFSMEPKEFAEMVRNVRSVEKSLGVVNYEVQEKEALRRRSLFVTADCQKGDILTTENIGSIRPGHGLHPKYLNQILGKKASRTLSIGEPLNWEMIDP